MAVDDRIKIISLHGYNSSHTTGFEASVRDAFSKKYDFECVNLLGHIQDRDMPELHSISDIVYDAVEKIAERVDGKTYLIGTSFGAYPVLEYLRQNSDVDGAVLVKPMVDIGHTFSLDPRVDPIRRILKIDEALKKYIYGTENAPFNVKTPSLILPGRVDDVVGDSKFVRERVVGRDLQYIILDGGHSDNRDDDIRKVVGEARYFFKQIEDRGRVINISPEKINDAYDSSWAEANLE